MMDASIINCSVPFEGFSLDFLVKLEESVEWTEAFRPKHGEGYVFASGEIWVRTVRDRTLLVEAEPGENLLMLLHTIERRFRRLRPIPGLEERIALGGWCHWIRGYWGRLNADASTQADEETYDLLSPALLVDGKNGWIAVYQYGRIQVLEAGTRSTSISVWSEVDPDIVCASINAVASQLSDTIRTLL
jgi:hypothetical protein